MLEEKKESSIHLIDRLVGAHWPRINLFFLWFFFLVPSLAFNINITKFTTFWIVVVVVYICLFVVVIICIRSSLFLYDWFSYIFVSFWTNQNDSIVLLLLLKKTGYFLFDYWLVIVMFSYGSKKKWRQGINDKNNPKKQNKTKH